MLMHAPVMALLLVALLGAAALTAASVFAVGLLRDWDVNQGSRRQIELERRSELVATVLAENTRMLVVPSSTMVKEQAEEEGLSGLHVEVRLADEREALGDPRAEHGARGQGGEREHRGPWRGPRR